MPSTASGRRKPVFSTGGEAPSAPSARAIDASWCSNPHPVAPTPVMHWNTVVMSWVPKFVTGFAPPVSTMNVAPASRPVDTQLAVGWDRNTPSSP